MTQVQGIPYRRHGPSAALREFLDHLDPGDYFDCGRARLHGLDDALLEEARSRGRDVGDDAFLLVATDMGLIFCRPSISFAIAARWEEVSLIRPRGVDPVVLPVTWPRHGELKFTLSKRLAGNIFRRWLQLRMQVARQARQADRTALGGAGASDGGESGVEEPGVGDRVDSIAEPGDIGGLSDIESLSDIEGLGDLSDIDGLGGDGDVGRHRDRERIDTVEPTRPSPAETADGFPLFDSLLAEADHRSLVDDELERVPVPRNTTPTPSWVGSAVSLAASLVVISTLVLMVTVSVSLWRGGVGDSSVSTSAGASRSDATPSTVDHERFRTSSDSDGQLAADGTVENEELSPSAAGGASQDRPSSSQQLLVVPPGPAGPDLIPQTDPSLALRCSSNYSGCVPDVDETAGADVDCLGHGDGPHFTDGEILVLGEDIYGLDTDGDRLACEADQFEGEPSTP